MGLPIILLILGIILICVGVFLLYKTRVRVQEDIATEQANAALEAKNKDLQSKNKEAENKLFEINTEIVKQMGIGAEQAAIALEGFRKAFTEYMDSLEQNYQKVENEYDSNIQMLEECYDDMQDKCLREYNQQKEILQKEAVAATADLAKLKAQRHAAMEAARREEEIKKQKEFYSLQISELDLNDIRMLEKIKPSLNKPRVLSMLIWTTWFRTPMTTLCNNVLGAKQITGIYKITNQLDNKCYIGQSKDVAERWKQHAKCGLDIDTPVGNKLYAAMKQDGIWNFTWELLEACSIEDLDKREKFYIDLYDSCNFGYNNTQGNK